MLITYLQVLQKDHLAALFVGKTESL
jgi:hypothetical protein